MKPVGGGSVSTAPTPSSFPFIGQDERERTDKSDNAVVTQRGSYVALTPGFTFWSGSIYMQEARQGWNNGDRIAVSLLYSTIHCTLQYTLFYSPLYQCSENRYFSAKSNRSRFAD